ncbi:MAG: adenylate kinase [Deltaproteobacteria bacterium]|nr:adenylate kinase [Deltaproteobacteria bacterium]
MKIILIGPPGAGKGTQAEKLATHWKTPRITTGDLFRQAVQNKTPMGLQVQGFLEKGALVPDDVVLGLMQERMSGPDCKSGFILDGFPRTVGQAIGLETWLKKTEMVLDAVVVIDVPEEEAVRRITGRRQCGACGSTYHLQFQPPRQDGICDKCKSLLVQRKDDEEKTVRHRLKVYAGETLPLIDFYKQRHLLRQVDGVQKPAEVFQTICSLIK